MTAGTAVTPDFPRTRLSSTPDSEAPGSAGFAVRLEGASLVELIQMECMRGMRRIIRVTSQGRVGYLFFDQGQVMHATAAGRIGESAAMWLLSWKNGTFETADQPWPLRTTIHCNWQKLVLTAAQREDEASRDSRPESGEMPVGAKLTAVPDVSERFSGAHANQPANETGAAVPGSDAPGSDSTEETHEVASPDDREQQPTDPEVLRAVRLDADGNVLSHVGAVGEFADISAYAVRLSALIGEALGLEGFQGIECVSEEKSFLAFWDDDTIVALEAKAGADIDQYRKRAGL